MKGRFGMWGLADQAVISTGNFLSVILLARSIAPSQFGAFSLVYAFLYLANSLQFVLITQPHNVLGLARRGDDYVQYTAAVAVGQLAFAFGGSVILLAAALLLAGHAASFPTLILAAIPALVGWQLQEFVRRVLYTEGRQAGAVLNDLVSYGGQVVIVVVLWRLRHLDGSSALLAYGSSSLIAGALGLWQIRPSLRAPLSLLPLRDNWLYGKWLVAGPAYWLTTQAYLYVAAALAGFAAAGALRAAQVLLGPINLFFAVFESILPIRFAREYLAHGHSGLTRLLFKAYMLTAPVIVGYCIAAAVAARPLLSFVYGPRYGRYSNILALFSLYYLVLYTAVLVSAALRAERRTAPIFRGYVMAGALSLSIAFPIVAALQGVGAVLGLIAGAIVFAVLLWHAYPERGGGVSMFKTTSADSIPEAR